MRISDWSSDVCSSDLGPIFLVKIQSSQFIVCIIIIYKQALFAPLPLAGNRAHKLSTALYFNALGGPVLTFRPSREGCECDRNAPQNRTHIGFKGPARRIIVERVEAVEIVDEPVPFVPCLQADGFCWFTPKSHWFHKLM